MIIESFPVGALQCNCSIIGCPETGEAAVIDPGGDPEKILDFAKEHKLTIKYLLHTHAHYIKAERTPGTSGRFGEVSNPATGETIARVPFSRMSKPNTCRTCIVSNVGDRTSALAKRLARQALGWGWLVACIRAPVLGNGLIGVVFHCHVKNYIDV